MWVDLAFSKEQTSSMITDAFTHPTFFGTSVPTPTPPTEHYILIPPALLCPTRTGGYAVGQQVCVARDSSTYALCVYWVSTI